MKLIISNYFRALKESGIWEILFLGFPFLLVCSVYLHFFSVLIFAFISYGDLILTAPDELPFSFWALTNYTLLVFITPAILLGNLVVLFLFREKNMGTFFYVNWFILLLFYATDPGGIFYWLLD